MSMRDECYELCRRLAANYDGWEFVGGKFVCKTHKPFVLGLEVFSKVAMSHVCLQAIEWVKVGPLVKPLEKIFPEYSIPIHFSRLPRNIDGSPFSGVYTTIDEAEPVIERFVESAIPLATNRYCLKGVREFVEEFPEDDVFTFIGMQGVLYCLLRMLVGDFQYFKKYYEEAAAGNGDYRLDELCQILPFLEEMEESLKKTGRLM